MNSEVGGWDTPKPGVSLLKRILGVIHIICRLRRIVMDFASAVVCWMVALIYGVTALLVSRRRKPFPFFTGVSIPAEMLTDLRAYNRANGIMWAIYSAVHVVSGLLALLSSTLGFVLFGLLILPGLVIMFRFHKRILRQYTSPNSKPFY